MGAEICSVKAGFSFWPRAKENGLKSSDFSGRNYQMVGLAHAGEERKSSYSGYAYRTIAEKIQILAETSALTDGLQYLVQFSVGAATAVTCGDVFRGAVQLSEINRYIDFVRTYSDIDYFISGECIEDWKKSYFAGLVSSTFYLAGSLGSCLSTASLFELADLNKLSSSFSQITLFGAKPLSFVANVALSKFCFWTATGAYFFGIIDTVMKIQEGDYSKSRFAYLAYCTAALAAQIFIAATEAIATTAAVFAVGGGLAMISAGFGAMWIYQGSLEARAAAKKLAL